MDELSVGSLPDLGGVPGLIEEAADVAVYLDPADIVSGISVSADCPSIGSLDHWVGRPFQSFLTAESRPKFADRIGKLRSDPDRRARPLHLNHAENARWEFPIRYTLHRVGEDGSVLLLGRDMQPIAEIQQRLVSEQSARERDQQKIRASETFYRVVLEASSTPMVLADPGSGLIRDMNSAASELLDTKPEALGGNVLSQAFEGRRRGELMEALQSAASAEGVRGVEVSARRNGRVVSLVPEFFRAAGELVVLCRIVPVDDDDPSAPEIAQALSALFNATSDAIILTDHTGVIREVNEAFLVMTDAARTGDVTGVSLSEFLVRGSVDLKLILDQLSRNGRMRGYSAQIYSTVGSRVPVDISAARLGKRSSELGHGLIIRDTAAGESAPGDAGTTMMSDDAMKNVMDLVGTASLKELVAATSDVVEKMCIETAVRMTSNNRAAAAEMLGLSRQSLYVKLRKHGLLAVAGDD